MTARRQWLRVALGGAAGAVMRAAAGATRVQWRERVLHGFGTTLWLRAGDTDAHAVETGLDAAVQAIRDVECQLSLFDPNSALCRLNRDGELEDPPPDLLAVLRLAHRVAEGSAGAFDVTVQPLWAAWAGAHREGRVPTDNELRAARGRVDWRAVNLGPAHAPRVQLRRPGMAITCNGIAQGWSADRAKAALQRCGVAHALLDTGEWSVLGAGPQGEAWTLGIAEPRPTAGAAGAVLARVQSQGRAVATSSDAHFSFSADHTCHHILDPRTGRSPHELASVTVVAPSAVLADALTKVFFMGGWSRAPALARRWGVDVLVVDKRGRWRSSPGLKLS